MIHISALWWRWGCLMLLDWKWDMRMKPLISRSFKSKQLLANTARSMDVSSFVISPNHAPSPWILGLSRWMNGSYSTSPKIRFMLVCRNVICTIPHKNHHFYGWDSNHQFDGWFMTLLHPQYRLNQSQIYVILVNDDECPSFLIFLQCQMLEERGLSRAPRIPRANLRTGSLSELLALKLSGVNEIFHGIPLLVGCLNPSEKY